MVTFWAYLRLPARPDLTDEQVRTAWRAIAAASHPDRPEGGNPAANAAASNAIMEGQLGPSPAKAVAATMNP